MEARFATTELKTWKSRHLGHSFPHQPLSKTVLQMPILIRYLHTVLKITNYQDRFEKTMSINLRHPTDNPQGLWHLRSAWFWGRKSWNITVFWRTLYWSVAWSQGPMCVVIRASPCVHRGQVGWGAGILNVNRFWMLTHTSVHFPLLS